VGALKKRKGFDVMIKALEIVVKTIPDAKYYIAGSQVDGNYTNYLKKLIGDLGLNNNIVLLGKVSDDELKEFYKKLKIFALTPLSDKFNFEGFGLVYLEANMYGLPVIGSYENGGEDAIKDGYNGFLAKANDPKDTAEKIIKLLNNQESYEKMSQNAKNWSQKMSWDNIIKKYLEIYEYKR
jgi:phosphatidylinositol alpha-1,6-mannosyltransferase